LRFTYLQLVKAGLCIFHKPLASRLSAEEQRSVYCTSSNWLTYLSRFPAKTAKEKLTELIQCVTLYG